MQQLWQDKWDWDTSLSTPLRLQWERFMSELPLLSNIALPCHIDVFHAQDIQLLGFADASQVRYAAVILLRIVHENQNVGVYFVSCKSKVAPLCSGSTSTTWTIHRLELCAALLLARILFHINEVLSSSMYINRIRAWTDSYIVLSWLTSDQKFFNIFFTNRVAKIHALLPMCQWSHVSTENNPADSASQGLLPADMPVDNLHTVGLDFLRLLKEPFFQTYSESSTPRDQDCRTKCSCCF